MTTFESENPTDHEEFYQCIKQFGEHWGTNKPFNAKNIFEWATKTLPADSPVYQHYFRTPIVLFYRMTGVLTTSMLDYALEMHSVTEQDDLEEASKRISQWEDTHGIPNHIRMIKR